MFNKFSKSIIIIVSIIFLLIGLILFMGYRFYNNVFRLSYDQIITSLEKIPSQCTKLADCKLMPGDIIIRRYVTEVTKLFDDSLNPYFTHSTFYLGNDELFEALGNYGPPENQVKITKFSESDWLYPDMDNFIVIRPKNYSGKLNSIILNLRNIANDPEYKFGPLKEDRKTVSCSDVILKYLADEKIINDLPDKPEIITPDYLFWVTERDKSNFEIVGYSINQK